MNRLPLLGGLAVLTLIGAAGVATAQQAPARVSAEVSRADFVARRVDRLVAADADRDGRVTPPEMAAARQAKRGERMASAFDRLDADRNGVLTREEFEARGAARAERRMARGPARAQRMATRGPVAVVEAQAKAEQAFDRLDADRDGVLTGAERRLGRDGQREQRRERRMDRRGGQGSPGMATSG